MKKIKKKIQRKLKDISYTISKNKDENFEVSILFKKPDGTDDGLKLCGPKKQARAVFEQVFELIESNKKFKGVRYEFSILETSKSDDQLVHNVRICNESNKDFKRRTLKYASQLEFGYPQSFDNLFDGAMSSEDFAERMRMEIH